jgi:hypothetical protein
VAEAPSFDELKTRYRAAAAALAQVDREELAALSDDEALRRTLSLRAFTTEPQPPSQWSGLVVQQALFHRIKLP